MISNAEVDARLSQVTKDVCADNPLVALMTPYDQLKAAALRLAERVLTFEKETALAFRLADEHALAVIDSSCVKEEVCGETWLSFGNAQRSRKHLDYCANEIKYLEARGLLHRHPIHAHLVRVKKEKP